MENVGMNKSFNEWYIENNIILSEEKQLSKRWLGVEEFSKEATPADITNLAMLFFGCDVEDDFLEKLCNAFISHDDFFSKKSLPEIRLLSGAILLQMAQKNGEYCNYIELLSKSASFVPGRAINSSILNEIELEFRKDSDVIRENLDVNVDLVAVPNNNKLLDLLKNRSWDEDTFTQLVTFITETARSFSKINEIIEQVSEINRIRLEESQLLWWLISGWSEINKCSYKSLNKEKACLFIGYEMAELVQVFPGPYAAESIVFRMIELCKGSKASLKFSNLVQAVTPSFSELLLRQYAKQGNLKLLPLSMAIKYANNTSSPAEWINKYTIESNNIDIVDKEFTPSEFAKQLYYEVLTQRCLDFIDK